MTTSHKRKWRFGIKGMLLTVMLCAVFLGVLANTSETHLLKATFSQMPADDLRLEEWYRAQPGIADLSIHRETGVVKIRYSKREFTPTFRALYPPWTKLGYTGLGSTTQQALRPSPPIVIIGWLAAVPIRIWIVAVFLVGLFAYLRWRRRETRLAG